MHTFARYARFLYHWHGLGAVKSGEPARGLALDKLQGYVLPYSDLETRVLPARIGDYQFGELDHWCDVGTLGWQGHERLSVRDGSVSIYRPNEIPRLARIAGLLPGARYAPLRGFLVEQDREFDSIRSALGGFPPQILANLWELVWAGEVSNRRLLPLLANLSQGVGRARSGRRHRARQVAGPSRLDTLPGSAGAWYLVTGPRVGTVPPAERDRALVEQLLQRWGIIGQPCMRAEGVSGGVSRLTPILDAMRNSGAVVEGVFVEGCGPTQFAATRTLDLLDRKDPELGPWVMAATDPANPYGKLVPWPKMSEPGQKPRWAARAQVVLLNGVLAGYLSATGHDLITFQLPGGQNARSTHCALIEALMGAARPGYPVLLRSVNGRTPESSPLAPILRSRGFSATRDGYIFRL